jgi:hypothetical protein
MFKDDAGIALLDKVVRLSPPPHGNLKEWTESILLVILSKHPKVYNEFKSGKAKDFSNSPMPGGKPIIPTSGDPDVMAVYAAQVEEWKLLFFDEWKEAKALNVKLKSEYEEQIQTSYATLLCYVSKESKDHAKVNAADWKKAEDACDGPALYKLLVSSHKLVTGDKSSAISLQKIQLRDMRPKSDEDTIREFRASSNSSWRPWYEKMKSHSKMPKTWIEL